MSRAPDTRAARRSVAQRLGQQRSARVARFQLVRVARKLSYRALARGDKAAAVRITATAVRRFPDYPFAVRLYARALLAPPATLGDVEDALSVLEPMMRLHPADDSCRGAYVEALLLKAGFDCPAAEVAEHLHPLLVLPRRVGFAATRQILERQRSWGRVDVLEAAVEVMIGSEEDLATGDRRFFADLIHEAAVMTDDESLAADVAQLVGQWPGVREEDRAHMAAAASLAFGRPDEAARVLEDVRPHRPANYSRQLVASHLALGRHDLVLEYLDGVNHGLSDVEASVLRYDALIALGRVDDADDLAAGVGPDDLGDPGAFRIFRNLCDRRGERGGALMDETLERFESTGELTAKRVSTLIWMQFELGRFDEVDRIHRIARRAGDTLLSPSARLSIAKAFYARRRFDEAARVLDTMTGAGNRWDADKLRARIMLELGHFTGALEHRSRFRSASGDFDEVLYHSLLQRGRFAEAFAMYLPPRDARRLINVFGERAEGGPDFPYVGRRMVISQAGPGDELTIASTYASLRSTCDELLVTCDPRLTALLGRSFPDIEFVPVERVRVGQPGAFAPDRQHRAPNVLCDLLTDDAMKMADDCDAVVLGRSLPQLAVGVQPAPYSDYLRPPHGLVRLLRPVNRTGSRRVGLVWRSELRGPMRDIHYLDVGDLGPLLSRTDQVVCLQHDANVPERSALEAMASCTVEFRDEIDLRNDFDCTAALLAGLDAVVGVGTTVLELSAAVGTPTVMVQPTHFGTWRATNAAGADFWHRSMRVVALDEPWRRDSLVEGASRMLDEIDVGTRAIDS